MNVEIGEIYKGEKDGSTVYGKVLGIRGRVTVPGQTHENVEDDEIHVRWRSEDSDGGQGYITAEEFRETYDVEA